MCYILTLSQLECLFGLYSDKRTRISSIPSNIRMVRSELHQLVYKFQSTSRLVISINIKSRASQFNYTQRRLHPSVRYMRTRSTLACLVRILKNSDNGSEPPFRIETRTSEKIIRRSTRGSRFIVSKPVHFDRIAVSNDNENTIHAHSRSLYRHAGTSKPDCRSSAGPAPRASVGKRGGEVNRARASTSNYIHSAVVARESDICCLDRTDQLIPKASEYLTSK